MHEWQPGLLDSRTLKGGWALASLDGRFLADANGVLFPLHWLRQQALPVRAEYGLGHYQGQPLVVLELQYPAEIAGAQWLTLRQLMMQSEPTIFKLLGYASQIITWACTRRWKAMRSGSTSPSRLSQLTLNGKPAATQKSHSKDCGFTSTSSNCPWVAASRPSGQYQ